MREDPLPSSLTWWLSGSSSSQATGLRDSVPPWLAMRSLPQLLTTWPGPPTGQLTTWLPPEQANRAIVELKGSKSVTHAGVIGTSASP